MRHRLSLALLLLALPLSSCDSAKEAADKPMPKLGEPGFIPPNPPSCAVEWADTMMDLSECSAWLCEATKDCAFRQGWTGQTPWGDRMNWPFHDQRTCTQDILSSSALLFSSVKYMEGAAFDCFGENQACGQSIAAGAEFLMDAAVGLGRAASDCPYVGDNPPWNSNRDLPLRGFRCWQDIWRAIQRMLKAAKYIDVAIETCDTTPPQQEPEPADSKPKPERLSSTAPAVTPQANAPEANPRPSPAPAPTPQAVPSAASAPAAAPQATPSPAAPPKPMPNKKAPAAAPKPVPQGAPKPSARLGAAPEGDWASLEMPSPFARPAAQAQPVERRLRERVARQSAARELPAGAP